MSNCGIAPRDNPRFVLMTYELRGDGTTERPYYEAYCIWDKETLEKIGEINSTEAYLYG